jgi:nucleoside recognition membrane protein YjiH
VSRALEAARVLWRRYRSAVRATVVASAAPYGYTLTIWTSGAVLSHARGIPNTLEALLFLIGAVAAYALVGGLAFLGADEALLLDPARAVVWGGLHIFSVGLAIGAASLVAHLMGSLVAWPLGSFLATAIYLVGSAVQLTLAHGTRHPPLKAPS